MSIYKRLFRYGLVGVMATGVHLTVLLILLRFVLLPTGSANVLAFIVAFLFSTTLQQQFTFADRLRGQSLKKRSVFLLFVINSFVAYGLGSQATGPLIPLLALVPPVINYSVLHFFSGHPSFKR